MRSTPISPSCAMGVGRTPIQNGFSFLSNRSKGSLLQFGQAIGIMQGIRFEHLDSILYFPIQSTKETTHSMRNG